MSIAIQPKITAGGLAALFNATNTGVALNLTHVSIGSMARTISGSELSLGAEKMRQAIGSSNRPTPDTIQMRTIFNPTSEFWVREVGIWAGTTLFAIWSTGSTGSPLGYCSPGVDWVFSHRLSLRELPAGSVNIVVDPNEAALMGIMLSHEQDPNAHGISSHLSVVLKSLADTNRLVLVNNYFK
jgi:hypothetical protein